MKTDLEKIRMAVELRRRGYSIDLENCKEESIPYFSGCHSAMLELLKKLQDMKYIDNYIAMKAAKYMSEKEKEEFKEVINNG